MVYDNLILKLMEVVDYYYKILDLKYTASNEEIMNSYKSKIDKYLHLPFLNENQKTEIKELKKAKFVLLDSDLRSKYDAIIMRESVEKDKMMDHQNKNNNKRDRVDSSLVGNRVFSMIGIINTPQRDFNFDRNMTNFN